MEIEIFSDVVCPWCFIGKRRLDTVVATEVGEGVTLRWRPYQLHPNLPATGMDRAEYLTRRYGTEADPARVPARIAEEATGEGIEFRFDRILRMPNTLLAHRLLEYAWLQGVQHALSEALFIGYFCEGVDVGDERALLALGAQVGLDPDAAAAWLADGGGVDEVREQLARGPEVGVSGVPGYLLAGAFLLPGAQSSEVMAQIISRAKIRLGQIA